jgi:hypothetical protein
MEGSHPRQSEITTFCNPAAVRSATGAEALATAINGHLDNGKLGAPRSAKGKGQSRLPR